MNIYCDDSVVLTLDAGGTNFVFSALQRGKEIVEPIVVPSYASNLDKCLNAIIEGFNSLINQLLISPDAISFAFPGPADYKNGIIGGDLPNFQSFKNGVPLGPMLEEIYGIPTYINNDGDLFTMGEAIAGFLPHVNNILAESGSQMRYRNLIGVTLGTGFGGGLVINNQLLQGDNSASGEIWLTRNIVNPAYVAEGGVSIQALKCEYARLSGQSADLAPKDIYEIGKGQMEGDKEAAITVFKNYAMVIAESLAHAITLFDGLIVIGGGVSGAWDLIVPHILSHLNGQIRYADDRMVSRLACKVFDADDPDSLKAFALDNQVEIDIPFHDKKVVYNPEKRIALGLSRLGTSQAIAIGAYAYALSQLQRNTRIAVEG